MAMEIDFEADAFDEGRHLRDVIRGHKGFSSALWKRIKWNGEVWLNGTRIHNAKTVLHEGDRVRLVWDESSDIVPADIPLDILYEDDTLLVVNKGTGMIIHPTNAGIHDTLVNAVAGYFQKKGEESGIHPVYRLDRNTTGVVVVAKSAKAQYALTRSMILYIGSISPWQVVIFPESSALSTRLSGGKREVLLSGRYGKTADLHGRNILFSATGTTIPF